MRNRLASTMLHNAFSWDRSNSRPGHPIFTAVVALHIALAAAAAPASAEPRRTDLSAIRSWGYQLQQVDPRQIAASSYDLMVIDYARDGTAETAFTAAEVTTMQQKLDGGSRLVLAYLSIGEAEDYRFYWQAAWQEAPPAWLGVENPDWEGNYAVRYWSPEWQSIIFGGPKSYLDAVIAAGFDGVYLDRVDAFEVSDPNLTRADRMASMSTFVDSLARYAREKRPGFVVVGQNAEELLVDDAYAGAIDAVGKEDLFFGLDGDGTRNARAELRASLALLQPFQLTGKPVFVVEYLDSAEGKQQARLSAAELGAPLFIADRELADVLSR